MNATLTFRLPYHVEPEGDVWVAVCEALDVSSQGENREQAGTMLIEALQLFLEACIEDGNLDAVLRECGFERAESDGDQGDDSYLDVPVSLLVASRGGATHAC